MTTVLVTGAAKRVAKAIALSLAKARYDIVLHYHRSENEALEVKRAIENLGQKAWTIQADFSQEDQSTFIKQVFDLPLSPSILIHSASAYQQNNFKLNDISDFDNDWRIHCRTPYMLNQALVKHKKKGQIIHLSDSSFHRSAYFSYMLSKNTIEVMTKMLAKELAPHFRVNAIAPGVILAPSDQSAFDLKALEASIPLQRQGSVSDICDAILFLLNHTYMTGQILNIDGGLSL